MAAFHQLVLDAVSAGWGEAEVVLVLADVADEYVIELAHKSGLPKLN
jgi:folate-dependent phosphoribosylglycinamide formyltransferase PurN